MPNQEHVNWLSQGVDTWNAKRYEQPFNYPDLTDFDIVSLCREKGFVDEEGLPNLIGIDFSNTDLRRANLSAGTVLREADFKTADLRETILNSADLRSADLRLATVDGAWMLGTKLHNANLRRTQIWKANLFYPDSDGTIQDKTNQSAILDQDSATIDKFSKMIDAIDQITLRYNKDKTINYYFRGEACNSWQLESSVMRDPNYRIAEADMLTELMARQPNAFGVLHSYFSHLVIARHYDLPTRLLDVTRNPLVALFNATERHRCNNEPCTKDGKIHVFAVPDHLIKSANSDVVSIISNFTRLSIGQQNLLLSIKPETLEITNELKRAPKDFSLMSIDSNYHRAMQRFIHFICQEKPYFENRIDIRDFFRVLVVEPEQRFDRIRAQSGAFILSAFHTRFERDIILNQVHNVPIYDHYVLEVPNDEKGDLIDQLEQINVSRETLLPGLEESARAIQTKYSARRRVRVSQSLSDSMNAIDHPTASGITPTHVAIYGHAVEVTDWTDAARKIITRLIEIGILSEEHLPITFADGSDRKFLVSDKSDISGKGDRERAEFLSDQVFFNKVGNPKLLMESCRHVVEQCDFNPEIVKIYWEYQN